MHKRNLEKAIFIGHSYHQKTKSSDFFINILSKKFCLEHYWDASWKSGKKYDVKKIKASEIEVVIFWQVLPAIWELNLISNKKIVVIPMYDACVNVQDLYWIQLRKFQCKFINFSNVLHQKVSRLGFQSIYLKYFPKVEKKSGYSKSIRDGYNLFFWERTENITWKDVKILISKLNINKIYYHKEADPGQKIILPDKIDVDKYGIQFSNWFENKEDYQNIIRNCDFYIAPRIYEGIGLSFLEAMSLGALVIAADKPTMNEYIENNVNGILFRIDGITPIPEITTEKYILMKKNSIELCKRGRLDWEEKNNEIFNYLKGDYNVSKMSLSSIGKRCLDIQNLSYYIKYFLFLIKTYKLNLPLKSIKKIAEYLVHKLS